MVSPVSFNCYLEYIMRESADDLTWIGVAFSGRTINNLRYADDIVLIAQSPQALQTLLDKVEAVSRECGLEINTKKTTVMTIILQKEQITNDNMPRQRTGASGNIQIPGCNYYR